MKYLILFFLALMPFLQSKAEMNAKPVQCAFQLTKSPDGNYEIVAKLIIEEGWHLFTPDPGGDGFLIPTSMTLDKGQPIEQAEKLLVKSKVVTKDIKEIGVVNYVEGNAMFALPIIPSAQAKKVSGIFSYQCCNDHMCLPPVDVNFTLEIKE